MSDNIKRIRKMNNMYLLAIIMTSIMMVSVFTLPNAYGQNMTQEQRKAMICQTGKLK